MKQVLSVRVLVVLVAEAPEGNTVERGLAARFLQATKRLEFCLISRDPDLRVAAFS